MPTLPDGTRSGPFAGVVIADLTHALSGPFCTMLLAELGARVIKIERPPAGDIARCWPPFRDGVSAFFAAVNRGKESLALEIDTAADREMFLELVRRADVVVENFRPGTLERHGIGFEALQQVNPRIILASISGFGSTGPDHWEGAYDSVIQAMSGIMSVTGLPDGPPTLVGDAIADCLTGTFAFGAIGAALYQRTQTGRGAHIDIAMFDCMVSVLQAGMLKYLNTGETPMRMGNASNLAAPFGVFRTGDGDLAICAADDVLFGKLCGALGVPDAVHDPRFADMQARLANLDTLQPLLETALSRRSAAAWMETLQHAGVPCGVVSTMAQAAEDPQTAARNMIVRCGPYRALGNPIKMSTLADPPERPVAPVIDGDGDAIRRELRGAAGGHDG